MATRDEDERRWREALDALGRDAVWLILHNLSTEYGPNTPLDVIATGTPYPSRAFVENWLKEAERERVARMAAIRRWVSVAGPILIAAIVIFAAHKVT